MFNLFPKKAPQGDQITFTIDGMHCSSCSLSIDSELEEIEGVIQAETSYAKSVTKVVYDGQKTRVEVLRQTIESLGYRVV